MKFWETADRYRKKKKSALDRLGKGDVGGALSDSVRASIHEDIDDKFGNKSKTERAQGAAEGAAMGSQFGPWGTLIGGIAGGATGGVSGLYDAFSEGGGSGGGSADDIEGLLQEMRELAEGIELPEYGQLDPNLEELVREQAPGELVTPEDLEAVLGDVYQMGPSAYEGISVDPALRDRQMDALVELQGIVDAGGMTARDEAELAKNLQTIQTQQRGATEAAKQDLAQRGLTAPGMELLAAMQSGQSAATQGNLNALEQQAIAQERKERAIAQMAGLAGGLRDQDYGMQRDLAEARDSVERFNKDALTAGSFRNADSRNQMSQWNQGNQMDVARDNWQAGIDYGARQADREQNMSGRNVDRRNQAQEHNMFHIPEQSYQDRLAKHREQRAPAEAVLNRRSTEEQRAATERAETKQAIVEGVKGAADMYKSYRSNDQDQGTGLRAEDRRRKRRGVYA